MHVWELPQYVAELPRSPEVSTGGALKVRYLLVRSGLKFVDRCSELMTSERF